MRVLRVAFAWLVEVRYLAGNLWSAVHEPATITRELSVQVHRALPAKLWAQVRAALDARGDSVGGIEPEPGEEARRRRAARAAILLMGDSGPRRAGAMLARREDLGIGETTDDRRSPRSTSSGSTARRTPTSWTETGRVRPVVWTLTIVGKRRKQRTVPVSGATIASLRAHWNNRDRDFDAPRAHGPLIAPQWIAATRAALDRHDVNAEELPYTVDAVGRLVRMAVQRLSVQAAALARI